MRFALKTRIERVQRKRKREIGEKENVRRGEEMFYCFVIKKFNLYAY